MRKKKETLYKSQFIKQVLKVSKLIQRLIPMMIEVLSLTSLSEWESYLELIMGVGSNWWDRIVGSYDPTKNVAVKNAISVENLI